MSDTLWGVIIGGVIGSIASFIGAYFSHQRWRKEKLLEYLKSERERKERVCTESLDRFWEGIKTETVHVSFAAAIFVSLPAYVGKVLDDYIDAGDKSDEAKRKVYIEMAVALQRVLTDIDGEIKRAVT